MMTALKRWIWPDPTPILEQPVTRHDVTPARLDESRAAEAREAKAQLVGSLMKLERRSWEIRQALAGGVLDIVAGEDR